MSGSFFMSFMADSRMSDFIAGCHLTYERGNHMVCILGIAALEFFVCLVMAGIACQMAGRYQAD